jgi:hypothetical protein
VEGERFAENNVGALDHQYTHNVETSQAMAARTPEVVKDLLNHSNFAWAAQNCRMASEAYVDLGLLHWRRGIDPRPDFEGAIDAYVKLVGIVRKYRLPKSDFDLSLTHAAMFLMDKSAAIEFFDEKAFETSRWACYECRLIHALHDQPPSDRLVALTDKHLAENDALLDKIFDAYFQLLGLRPSKQDMEDRVRRAKSSWVERKRDALMAEGRLLDGHGVMNDLYVDIYLAAVLKKIGWVGHTVHAWIWD